MKPADLEKLTDEFFAAIVRREWDDVVERIHPEARAVQNISGEEVGGRDLLQSMRGLVESLSGLRYERPRRVVGVDAVVEQHDVCMTRPDGVEVVVDVCIILRFGADGLIHRIDEYLDSAQVRALF